MQADNIILRSWGSPRYIGDDEEKLFNHVDLAERLGILDQQNGVEVAGRGFAHQPSALSIAEAHRRCSLISIDSSKGLSMCPL